MILTDAGIVISVKCAQMKALFPMYSSPDVPEKANSDNEEFSKAESSIFLTDGGSVILVSFFAPSQEDCLMVVTVPGTVYSPALAVG